MAAGLKGPTPPQQITFGVARDQGAIFCGNLRNDYGLPEVRVSGINEQRITSSPRGW